MSSASTSVRAPRGVLARNLPRRGVVSRPDFFFFHGDLTGGGFYCLTLAGHVGRDQPLYGVAPPGHDGGPIAPDFESLVVDQLQRLRATRPTGPYRLGGYCNGALVAFELARRLEAAGERVERLVLVAPIIPIAGGRLGAVSRRLEERGAYYLHRARAFASVRLDEKLRYLRAKARALAGLRKSPGLELPSIGPPPRPRPPDYRSRDFFRNIGSYLPGRYDGPVDVLWPAEERRGMRRRSARAWRRVVKDLRTRMVPGDHYTCLTDEAAALGAAIRECLGEARRPAR